MDIESVRYRVPGVALCALLALPCWLLGKAFPIIGGPVFGILLGMLVALVWKERGSLQSGVNFTSKKVLQYAIILLGLGLNLTQIAKVGAQSLPVIVSTIATSLIVAFFLSKAMHIPGKIATLVGVGSSICGGSAIAATAPVIKAEDEDVATAISVVFLFNILAALIFPTLGGMLGLSNEGFGLFAGTAVNDTSSVTAAAASWDGMHPGANTLDNATIVKLTRTLAIIPITLALAIWTMRSEARKNKTAAGGGTGNFSFKRAFPMFILWFLAASIITTIAALAGVDPAVFAPFKDLSKYFIVMAMLAIGLNTDLVKLVRSGGKPIVLGMCCWVAITAVSLGVQYAIGIW